MFNMRDPIKIVKSDLPGPLSLAEVVKRETSSFKSGSKPSAKRHIRVKSMKIPQVLQSNRFRGESKPIRTTKFESKLQSKSFKSHLGFWTKRVDPLIIDKP